jgi:dephospho-CoA kinase
MIIIGLAGSIGSGKSTVSAYLQSLGIPVFDSENTAKSAVMVKGSPCLQKIAKCLGPDSILPSGELNRPWIAENVFRNRELLQIFETILKEQVWNDLQRFLAIQKSLGAKFVFLDFPLMIERGLYKICDSIWLIAVPDEIRIQRAILRDRHLGKEAVIERNKTQLPLSELKKYANVIIDNSGTFENTKAQINELLQKL